VGFRNVRGALEKKTFLVSARIQTPESTVCSLVTVPTAEQLICTLERILFKMVN
jgi:hypothetical protein